MTGIQGKIASGFRGSGSRIATQMGSEISAKSAAIAGAVAGVASAAVNKAMGLITSSIGDAVSRVDALSRFPTVMENLGYSSKDATKEVDRIATSLIGLPSSLDQITTFVQRIAPVSGSLSGATDTALAFNNAVLAGGGPLYRQGDAIEQFSQMLSKGKPDMMAWRTLQEAMPATLSQTAKALGIASGDTSKLYEQLKSGKISFEDFTGAIVKLNDKGLPGFKSFSEQAKDSTAGIGTGIKNMQLAVTRGIAKIMTSIGQENISNAIGQIGKAFESALNLIARILPPVLDTLGDFFGVISRNKDIIMPIVVGLGALIGAVKIWIGITKLVAAAQTALNIVLAANPIGLIIVAIVALVAGLVYFFTKTETGKAIMQSFFKAVSNVWQGIMNGLRAVGGFFVATFNRIKSVIGSVVGWIRSNWRLLAAILFGPIGIAVGVITRNIGTIKNAFSAGFNFIKGLWGKLTGFFTSIFNNIKNAFSGMVGIGKGIVTGIWKGIVGMGSWIKEKIVNFVKEHIPGPVRKFLGIESPSRLFAAIGHEIPRGMALGIDKTSGLVEKSVTKMAEGALGAVGSPLLAPTVAFGSRAAAGAASAATGAVTNQSVEIHHVHLGDQSAVREFFNQLNRDVVSAGMGLTPRQGAL